MTSDLGSTTEFRAGDVSVSVESRFGGSISSYLIGVNPDRSFVIGTTELTQDEEGLISAWDRAHWFGADGQLIATADLPLQEQFIFVDHPVALADNGLLYYLVTLPDRVEIRELGWRSPT